MTIEKTIIAIADVLKEKDYLKVAGIHEENHDPHPFTVDKQHTDYAKDANGGILDEDILEMFPCAHPKCKLPYVKHKATRTLMLQLKRNLSNEKTEIELLKIKPVLAKHHVSQIAFVDTEKGYKFI